MSSTTNATWRMPRMFAGACPSPPRTEGEWNFTSSSRPWPHVVSIIANATRTPSSPTTRSTQPPSTCPSPCSLSPSSPKNAVAASRSSTTMPRAPCAGLSCARPGVSDVSHAGRLDRLDLLELHISHLFEQPSAASEQDRDDRDDDLVEQTRCEVLLRDGRPAPERHLLLSGCCPRLFERRLDPVRDEVERRSALHLQRLARLASEDEDGMVEGRIVSPPALPRLVPRSRTAAEHVPAHDGRAGAAEDVLGERGARVDLAAFLAVALAERLEWNQPIVELLTADPERMLRRLVRAGDEAVDRHRDVQLQRAHRSSLCRHARRTAQHVRSHRPSQELDEAGDTSGEIPDPEEQW